MDLFILQEKYDKLKGFPHAYFLIRSFHQLIIINFYFLLRRMYNLNQQDFEQLETQPITKIVKLKIFDFSTPVAYQNFLNMSSKNNQNSIKFRNSMTARPIPIKQAYTWKPKIPIKKLFQQPKFLMSLQRKKVRVINGMRSTQLSADKNQRSKQFHGDKRKSAPRVKKQMVQIQINQQAQSQQYQRRSQRKIRYPHLNFNMHHLISKAKRMANHQQFDFKAGSNLPYYSYFNSQKFHIPNHSFRDSNIQSRKLAKTTMNVQRRNLKASTANEIQK